MATWREFEREAPGLATRVREAFGRGKHATMATLRADGSPRISGTEVEFTDDGDVRLGSMPGAVKARDLLRDPRVAVHSPTAEPGEGGADWPGEAKVAGAAVAQPDREDGAHVFDLDLTEVVWTGLNEARDALVIWSWHPGRGMEERTRACTRRPVGRVHEAAAMAQKSIRDDGLSTHAAGAARVRGSPSQV